MSKKIRVLYVFRKRREFNFSIEMLFNTVSKNIDTERFSSRSVELPFYSNGFFKRLLNIIFVAFFRSDVYHITGDVNYVTYLLPRRKTVLTVHDCSTLVFDVGVKASVFRLLWLKIPCYLSALVTTVSQKTKGDLVGSCGVDESKITVVNNFVSDVFTRCNDVKPYCKYSILTVGTKDNKNLPLIIKVASRLKLKINIVGLLSESLLQLLRELDVDYDNHLNLTDLELVDLYKSSGALMFPSTFEGFGLPIIEAQILGVPVVTSSVEPMCSVAGNGAVLVDPYCENSVYKGTKRLFEDESYRDYMINRGFENCEKYTLKSTVLCYSELYEKIVSGSKV